MWPFLKIEIHAAYLITNLISHYNVLVVFANQDMNLSVLKKYFTVEFGRHTLIEEKRSY